MSCRSAIQSWRIIGDVYVNILKVTAIIGWMVGELDGSGMVSLLGISHLQGSIPALEPKFDPAAVFTLERFGL